jgi:hypothetical protein
MQARLDTWLSLATDKLLTSSSSLHATFNCFFSLRLKTRVRLETRVFWLFLVASGLDLTSLGALQFLAKCPGCLQLFLLSFLRSILAVAFEERLKSEHLGYTVERHTYMVLITWIFANIGT